jgi:hypothetical protein
MKVMFERIKDLKPWATLLGDETIQEEEEAQKNPIKKAMTRLRKKPKS